jgi:predicted nicotinamide N-methyase
MILPPTTPQLSAEATVRVQETLERLRGEFEVESTEVSVAGRLVTIHHPRSAEALIDENAFDNDERLPYWADIWPAAGVLANRIVAMSPGDRRFLELGCGAGLGSVAAAMAGFDVTATDYYEDALRFTALNVLANTGALIHTQVADWRRFPHDLGRFDLVVASDVLYERPYAELIASVIDRTLTARGTAVITDPGRLAAPEFLERCTDRGMISRTVDRVAHQEPGIRQTIDVYEIRRR